MTTVRWTLMMAFLPLLAGCGPWEVVEDEQAALRHGLPQAFLHISFVECEESEYQAEPWLCLVECGSRLITIDEDSAEGFYPALEAALVQMTTEYNWDRAEVNRSPFPGHGVMMRVAEMIHDVSGAVVSDQPSRLGGDIDLQLFRQLHRVEWIGGSDGRPKPALGPSGVPLR